MIEFNPDGSIKLAGYAQKSLDGKKRRMSSQRCMKIEKSVVSFDAPKKCMLKITLSNLVADSKFVENIHRFFAEKASVPTKIRRINEKEFEVEIGTDFRRCTDCCALVAKYRDFMDGNLIEEKGSCTFEGRNTEFCYEDYFE